MIDVRIVFFSNFLTLILSSISKLNSLIFLFLARRAKSKSFTPLEKLSKISIS